MRKLSYLILPLILIVFIAAGQVNSDEVIQTVKGIFEVNQNIKSLSYEFGRTERLDGKLVHNIASVKYTKRPYRMYMREIKPNEGLEVLYPHPNDPTMALVNPNGFPWINLKLDPYGDLMSKDQHHSIYEGGYDYIVSVLEHIFYKYKTQINDIVSSEGMTLYDGQTCDLIVMKNDHFTIMNYSIAKGETVASIAKKHHLSKYLIGEMNGISNLNEAMPYGTSIKLPTDYAAKVKIWVDRSRNIPLKIEIYDDQGLFERYEFKNVRINPDFAQNEFEDHFQGYNFN